MLTNSQHPVHQLTHNTMDVVCCHAGTEMAGFWMNLLINSHIKRLNVCNGPHVLNTCSQTLHREELLWEAQQA